MNSDTGHRNHFDSDTSSNLIEIREPFNSVPANVTSLLELENVNLTPPNKKQ